MEKFTITYEVKDDESTGRFRSIIVKAESEEKAKEKLLAKRPEVEIIGVHATEDVDVRKGMPELKEAVDNKELLAHQQKVAVAKTTEEEQEPVFADASRNFEKTAKVKAEVVKMEKAPEHDEKPKRPKMVPAAKKMYLDESLFDYEDDKYSSSIARLLNVSDKELGKDLENVELNITDIEEDQFEYPEDFENIPRGWTTKKEWDKFVANSKEQYWLDWEDLINEYIGYNEDVHDIIRIVNSDIKESLIINGEDIEGFLIDMAIEDVQWNNIRSDNFNEDDFKVQLADAGIVYNSDEEYDEILNTYLHYVCEEENGLEDLEESVNNSKLSNKNFKYQDKIDEAISPEAEEDSKKLKDILSRHWRWDDNEELTDEEKEVLNKYDLVFNREEKDIFPKELDISNIPDNIYNTRQYRYGIDRHSHPDKADLTQIGRKRLQRDLAGTAAKDHGYGRTSNEQRRLKHAVKYAVPGRSERIMQGKLDKENKILRDIRKKYSYQNQEREADIKRTSQNVSDYKSSKRQLKWADSRDKDFARDREEETRRFIDRIKEIDDRVARNNEERKFHNDRINKLLRRDK